MEERFETFTVLIAKISRHIRRLKTEEVASYNLKSAHVSCLYYLYKAKKLTAKELSALCEEDKAAISRSLDYLEKNGYVFCESIGQKRYKAPLALTEKGEEIGRFIAMRIDSFLEKASEGLSEEHRMIMYQSLALVEKNLEKIYNTSGEEKHGN